MAQAMTLTLNRLLVHIDETTHEPDRSLACAFSSLVAAVDCAFRQEENLMEETAYAGLHAQRKDNALILSALHHADARVACGEIAIGREVIAALPGLLSLHRLTALGMLNHGIDGGRGCEVMRNGRIRAETAPRHRVGRALR